MKVKYTFATQETVEIEVSENLYKEIKEIERKTRNSDKQETRRHLSANEHLKQYGYEIADVRDLFAEHFSHELWEQLMQPLNEKQRELCRKRFLENQTVTAIATAQGVSTQAIENRLKKIFERLLNKTRFM